MSLAWEAAGGSDVGRVRRNNEDAFRLDAQRGVFLVADGMGGHAAGEVASALAADTALELLSAAAAAPGADALPAALGDAFHLAHRRIRDCCAAEPRNRGMGTTLTALVLRPDLSCHVGHIGDSRLYRLRGGRLEQLTRDHTWVQREVDAGRLAPAAARSHHLSHILTRVLSDDLDPEPDLLSGSCAPGDLLLLASDGLYNLLPDPAIARLLGEEGPLPDRVQALLDAANAAGGVDNVTVVLVRIVAASAG